MERLQERVDGKDENGVEEATMEVQQTWTLLIEVNKTIDALEKCHNEVKMD